MGRMHRQAIHLAGNSDKAVSSLPICRSQIHIPNQSVYRHPGANPGQTFFHQSADGKTPRSFHIDGYAISGCNQILHSLFKEIRSPQKILFGKKDALRFSFAPGGIKCNNSGNLLGIDTDKPLRIFFYIFSRRKGQSVKPFPVSRTKRFPMVLHFTRSLAFSPCFPVKRTVFHSVVQSFPQPGYLCRTDKISAAGPF